MQNRQLEEGVCVCQCGQRGGADYRKENSLESGSVVLLGNKRWNRQVRGTEVQEKPEKSPGMRLCKS